MDKAARLASIGVGMIGKVHARTLAAEPLCDYVAICDPDPAVRALAESFGVPYYADYEEMIRREKPDGAVIAVPNDEHAAVGSYCAEQDVHVFMDKPIAPGVDDAERLIRAADRSGVQLLVGHHRRFNPLLTAMKGILEGEELGRIVGISMLWGVYKPADYFKQGHWRTQPGGGPILINLIHEIDNLRYIYGEIASVYAEVSNAARGFAVEDTVGVTLRMTDGAIANILLTDTAPSVWSYEATMGESDFFFPCGGNIYHFLGVRGSIAFPEMLKVSYPEAGPRGWQHALKTEHLGPESASPYPAQMRHFCEVVLGREQPRTTGPDALQSLKVAMAVIESGKSRLPVEIESWKEKME